jgi:Methyltransferase domain
LIEVRECVICEGGIRRLRRALVAPFLAERIWKRSPFCVDLVGCESCGFMFYNPRLEASEERRLYADYRLGEYQRMRQASEPWYTKRFNAGLASESSYEYRRGLLRGILREHLRGRKVERVLDYGGDRGDLVSGLVDGAAAYVYDISGIAPAKGVTATRDPAGTRADLIVNSNVLEHVGFPRQIVADMVKMAPSGGLIFVEVPSESPFGAMRMMRRVAQIGWMAARRPSLARFVARPASLYLMHEHINFYGPRALGALMRKCGCSMVAQGTYEIGGKLLGGVMAWYLGRVEGD